MKVFNKLKSIAAAAILGVASLGMATTANALPAYITGSAQITGPIVSSSTSGVTFDPLVNYTVQAATGDMVGLNGLIATMTNIDLTNTPASLGTVWEAGGFSFTLTAVQTLIDLGDGIKLIASGVLKAAGFLDTKGVFNLTSNSISGKASFSSTTAVPLPASLLLLGGGLVAFGAVARRRNKKADLAA